jgi:hypothetical protein
MENVNYRVKWGDWLDEVRTKVISLGSLSMAKGRVGTTNHPQKTEITCLVRGRKQRVLQRTEQHDR